MRDRRSFWQASSATGGHQCGCFGFSFVLIIEHMPIPFAALKKNIPGLEFARDVLCARIEKKYFRELYTAFMSGREDICH